METRQTLVNAAALVVSLLAAAILVLIFLVGDGETGAQYTVSTFTLKM